MKVKGLSTLGNIWDSLTIGQQTALIVGFVGAVASGITLAIWGAGVNFYYTFLTSFTLSALSDRFGRYMFENTIKKELKDTILRQHDLKYIGSSQAGFEWFKRNSAGLKSVDNTVMRSLDGPPGHKVEDAVEKYVDQVRAVISKNCHWRDALPAMEIENVDAFFQSMPDAKKRHYNAAVFSGLTPIFQITILRYDDNTGISEKLLFGYGYKKVRKTMVFVSEDPETVNFFSDYFELLYTGGDCLYDRGKRFSYPPSRPPLNENMSSQPPSP